MSERRLQPHVATATSISNPLRPPAIIVALLKNFKRSCNSILFLRVILFMKSNFVFYRVIPNKSAEEPEKALGDLILAFQYLNGDYKKDGKRLFTRAVSDRTRRNNFKKEGELVSDEEDLLRGW